MRVCCVARIVVGAGYGKGLQSLTQRGAPVCQTGNKKSTKG